MSVSVCCEVLARPCAGFFILPGRRRRTSRDVANVRYSLFISALKPAAMMPIITLRDWQAGTCRISGVILGEIMCDVDALQLLRRDAPEFAIYHRVFTAFYSIPAGECRIALCGGANAGITPPARASNPLPPNTAVHHNADAAAPYPRYIRTPPLTADFQRQRGVWETALGADLIVLSPAASSGRFSVDERRFLQALHGHFPDLGRRLIILIMQNEGDPTSRQRRRDVLSEELAALPIAPPVIVAARVPGTNVAHSVSLFRLRPAIRLLGRQWPVSLAGYPGGLTAMRTSSIKALLGAMDDCIARAIKTRHKQVSAGEDRLNADYLYWQRDLALLGDRLRTRINGSRQR